MDFRKILTLLAGVILAGDYIQAYPLTAAEEVTKPSGSQHGYGYVVDYYAHPKYQFDYYVHDPHTGDVKKQWESRDGDVVKGSYTINDPDGTIRTVEYTADKHTGFNAVVRRQGKSYHPQTVISHEKAYDGGHTEQAADVDQGVHTEAIAEGVTSEKADYGSDVVQYEHQPTVTFQEAPLQSSSHQTVIRHIVSQPITWYHPQQQVAANQATELQAEPPQQAEPHQAAHYQPEEETKYEPTAEVNKINEVAHQTEEDEHAEEVSETNVENTQHTNAEQIQPDDDNGYYMSMSFDSQRYPTGKKTTSTK